jgi:hypothetical protein
MLKLSIMLAAILDLSQTLKKHKFGKGQPKENFS